MQIDRARAIAAGGRGRPSRRVERDPELLEPAMGEARDVTEIVPTRGEGDVAEAVEQRLERDLRLQAGEWRAHAEVDPLAEGEMGAGVAPSDVESVGPSELALIPVGRRVEHADSGPGRDLDPAEHP